MATYCFVDKPDERHSVTIFAADYNIVRRVAAQQVRPIRYAQGDKD